MGKKLLIFIFCTLLATSSVAFCACGGNGNGGASGGGGGDTIVNDLINGINGGIKKTVEEDTSLPERDPSPSVLENNASGEAVFDGNGAAVDYSNASDGYILARYDGDNEKVKLQITMDGDQTYTYDVWPGSGYDAFPLSLGSGNYNIAMFINIEGDTYSQACAQAVYAEIKDEFSPFLRSNQFSSYTSGTMAVAKGAELAQGSRTDMKVIENIFIFIVGNVAYDYDKAAAVQSGYLPDVDETLATGKGICFDYAALMTCMLRSQKIPCKLVVGYAGTAYHAWISVHVKGVGWVANMIQFNDDKWTFMDPTFASSGDTADPNVVGDGENYNPVYYY